MTKKCYVIITSIQKYTDQVYKFSEIREWQVLVIGDKKTPQQPNHNNIIFLPIEEQELLTYAIAKCMPYNHYCRKNIGYLYAIKNGANIIFDTDDDNAPLPGAISLWDYLARKEGIYDEVYSETNSPVNIYRHFSGQAWLWPRGLPLNFNSNLGNISYQAVDASKIAVWQGLVNGDPDVDAIQRLVFGIDKSFSFNDRQPLAVQQGVFSPFNSQNTMWFRDAFYFLYLPTTVSFRFTDILRGFIAQRCLWAQSLQIGYTKATAYQERNNHSYQRDFEQEVSCYLSTPDVLITLKKLNLSGDSAKDLFMCYEALCAIGVVAEEELTSLKSWIHDLQNSIE